MPWRRSKSDGLHITKVGLWFGIFILVIAVGATNTGNNGLFLALAVMGGVMIVSDVAGRLNVRGLSVELSAPEEIFANSPAPLSVELANPSRWLPRWLLVLTVKPEDVVRTAAGSKTRRLYRRAQPFLAAHLTPSGASRGQIEVMMRRRGRWRVDWVHAASLFPLGFFRRGRRYRSELEILVYPEIYAPSPSRTEQLGRAGDEPTRRRGWGHDLLGLRPYRHGDDPRNVHWKQSARTGDLIFKERETEENRRLQIVFDNAVGTLQTDAERQRFERLVSEAATAALDHLDRGFEISLLSRDVDLPFDGGWRQRRRVLEALALMEPRPEDRRRLTTAESKLPHLRLAMEPRDHGDPSALRGVA